MALDVVGLLFDPPLDPLEPDPLLFGLDVGLVLSGTLQQFKFNIYNDKYQGAS